MYSKNLKIGILGSGVVGRVLANAFLTEGNAVMYGTRDINKPEIIKWETENPQARIGSFQQTAQFGDVLILPMKGDVAVSATKLGGIENFKDKKRPPLIPPKEGS